MRRTRTLACWFGLGVAALGCSDRIDVLTLTPVNERWDGGGLFDGLTPGDVDLIAGSSAPGAGAGSVVSGRPDDTDADACDPRCPANMLCANAVCVQVEGVSALHASFSHVCAVVDGRLFCWGANETGQLGLADRDDRLEPARVGSFNDWLAVSSGEHHSCAIRVPGELYCFGDNSTGQLGLGDNRARDVPTPLPTDTRFARIACGGDSCCAIDDQKQLWCWGDNLEGKPGLDDPYGSPDVLVPTRVDDSAWRLVVLGQGHVCGAHDDGSVYCWGRNTDVETGVGPSRPLQLRVPTAIASGLAFSSLAAGQHHSCGVSEDGKLWCWGLNPFGEIGQPLEVPDADTPLQVGSDQDWQAVASGWFHTCALKRDQSLYCFGRAIEGQLGVRSDDPIPSPTQVHPPERWQRFTTGHFYSCAVDDTGTTYCFGDSQRGALGLGDTERRFMPEAVPSFAPFDVP